MVNVKITGAKQAGAALVCDGCGRDVFGDDVTLMLADHMEDNGVVTDVYTCDCGNTIELKRGDIDESDTD